MIIFSAEFKKRYKKLAKKLQLKVDERLLLFEIDKFDGILDNHKLTGEYAGCRSIDITGDYRVVYEEVREGIYKLVTVGTHTQLYGK